MPAFIAALLIGIGPVFVQALFSVLLSIGIGFGVFVGIDASMTVFKTVATSSWGGLPSAVVGILGLLRVDQALNLIISAATARFVLQGMTGGGLRKLIWKAPPA